jgi:RNA polymerase sigma-70 factor (ECF subfamily)
MVSIQNRECVTNFRDEDVDKNTLKTQNDRAALNEYNYDWRGQDLNLADVDDAVLMGMVASARTEALGALYDRYGRLVFTIAIHVVGDRETAEEITQDVFVRVWEGAATYRAELAKVSTWLVGITRHRAIDELRRRGARPERLRVDWPEDLGMDHLEGLPVLDGPHELVETNLSRHGIREAIRALPHDQRIVLNLAFFMGLSHNQMAEFLGQPLGTVKSRVRLAMQKLRETLVKSGAIDQEPGG